MEDLQLISRARQFGDAIALQSGSLKPSFNDVLDRSAAIADALLSSTSDLQEARVAYLLPAGFEHVAVQWGIWRAGGVAVPLSLSATERELEYTLADSQSHCVVTTAELDERVNNLSRRLNLRLLRVEDVITNPVRSLPVVDPHRRALILYTSGTTSRPKGVVTTHANILAQIQSLVEAWEWQKEDSIPLFLPLHHIHGIINVMSCALWSGAVIEPFPRFDMSIILSRVATGAWTLFMAVPTIYVRLIQGLESLPDDKRSRIIASFSRMRLMVSGSAALPASIHEKWTALTGQSLLERYGMTEIGMALSNPYHGERRPGTVGQPLPNVEIRLKTEQGELVTTENEPGEIQVRGPGVFSEYWNRPDVTADSFEEGWFRTGDIAVLEDGYYRIMGRQSVDIIKSGGYKLSALEIEAVLLEHPAIRECAVVGVTSETWGESVAVAAVLQAEEDLSLDALRTWSRERLSAYKVPKQLLVVPELPRNAMGKITKPAVRELF